MDVSVSVLGTGALGTALARLLLDRGHRVTVWNRTPGKAQALGAAGAAVAGSPDAAVAAGDLVFLCLTDYPAVDQVLDAVTDALPGRVVVNLATGAPEPAQRTADRVGRAGADYLDGVLQGSPGQLGGAGITLLHSGSAAAFGTYRSTLEQLGTTHYLGPDPGQACRYDLALLGLWYEAQLAYLNAMVLVGATGPDELAAFAGLAGRQLGYVTGATGETAREVAERRYPRGPADLTEHAPVLDELLRQRGTAGLSTAHLRHLRDAVRRRIDQGHGAEGLTGVIEELGALPVTPRR
ncbi:NAD(P)-dependent oxidoreductase [Plantactinospora endophytica]|uniref:6-phosphogluconate dehydrogenase n=1 Tax=Plantactinospora endophytica TaxID=673535 RepID=A0ABQ4E9E5_9ACTN|nr:NAD(P)-binding domain-containing protein [Plantactinospora endophytica]GIG91295.1 6-phosphogluconate dehydrogenase [Plantactinospora endophytica]